MTTIATQRVSPSLDRLFYSGMALAIAVVIFTGFAPSYFLRSPAFAGPPLTPLVHLHASLAASFVLLLVLQTWLVAGRQLPIHRKLGWVGAALATAIVLVGPFVAIATVQRGALPPGLTAPLFMILPLGGLVTFAIFIGAGVLMRNSAETHKRLMLLGTISVLDAGFARMPGILEMGPLVFYGLADIFLIVAVVYDLVTRRRVHPVWLWGGSLLILSQPLRLMLAQTEAWAAFTTMLTG
jgi:hypothetical protein